MTINMIVLGRKASRKGRDHWNRGAGGRDGALSGRGREIGLGFGRRGEEDGLDSRNEGLVDVDRVDAGGCCFDIGGCNGVGGKCRVDIVEISAVLVRQCPP